MPDHARLDYDVASPATETMGGANARRTPASEGRKPYT